MQNSIWQLWTKAEKSILFYLCYTAYHMSPEYSMAIQQNTLGYKTPINVTRSLTIWPYKKSLL